MFATMSAPIAVFSDDSALCNRLLDCLRVDRTSLDAEFEDRPARTAPSPATSHVVVIDAEMNGALRLCADLTAAGNTRVVMIGVADTVDAAVETLRAGAVGIVYKSQPLGDVSRAVEVVAKGEVFAPRHVVLASWMRLRSEIAQQQVAGDPEIAQRLSFREREVFRHAAVGLSNKELARCLLISEATVKVHLTHIFHKLGLRGRGELAAAYFGIRRPS